MCHTIPHDRYQINFGRNMQVKKKEKQKVLKIFQSLKAIPDFMSLLWAVGIPVGICPLYQLEFAISFLRIPKLIKIKFWKPGSFKHPKEGIGRIKLPPKTTAFLTTLYHVAQLLCGEKKVAFSLIKLLAYYSFWKLCAMHFNETIPSTFMQVKWGWGGVWQSSRKLNLYNMHHSNSYIANMLQPYIHLKCLIKFEVCHSLT